MLPVLRGGHREPWGDKGRRQIRFGQLSRTLQPQGLMNFSEVPKVQIEAASWVLAGLAFNYPPAQQRVEDPALGLSFRGHSPSLGSGTSPVAPTSCAAAPASKPSVSAGLCPPLGSWP